MKKGIIVSLVFIVVFSSLTIYNYNCISLPATPYHYLSLSEMPTDIINNAPDMDNTPTNNPSTDVGIALGRVLFYDQDLSKNKTVSCASCHKQEFAFSDTARFSLGWNGGLTGRNSMTLIHARFHRGGIMFWDGRAASIEAQVTMPLVSAVEMGMTMDSVIARVASKSFYKPLFRSAFGRSTIDSISISKALAQFVRSINSYESKYRTGVEITSGTPESTPFSNFTAQENLGKDLFMDINRGNCQACHTRNIFVPQGAQNNGLDGSIYAGGKWKWTPWLTRNDYIGKDSGFAGYLAFGKTPVLRDSNQMKLNMGRMKVPSLINISKTAPYMHDGRFKTLDEVIDFYSDSIKNNDYNTLSAFFRRINPRVHGAPNNVTNQLAIDTAPVRVIHFTPTEKAALKAFLLTLTDESIGNDIRYSNPFCSTTNKSSSGIGTVSRFATQKQQLFPVLSADIFPNPASAKGSIFIRTIAGQNFSGTIRIYAMDGRLVYQKNMFLQIGANEINLSGIINNPGTYIVQLINGGKTEMNKKVIIN